MNYSISRKRIISLIGRIIKEVYPRFNKEDCEEDLWNNEDSAYYDYYDAELKKNYARYHIWSNVVEIREELFNTLRLYLGEESLGFFLIWFEHEFGKEADFVDYF